MTTLLTYHQLVMDIYRLVVQCFHHIEDNMMSYILEQKVNCVDVFYNSGGKDGGKRMQRVTNGEER